MRASKCNLHGEDSESGITATIPQMTLKQLMLSIPKTQQYNSHTDMWLEAGSVKLGPINLNVAMGLPYPKLGVIQDVFLRKHDRRSHRLTFLWPALDFAAGKLHLANVNRCACLGGCPLLGNIGIGLSIFRPNEQSFLHNLKLHVCDMLYDDERDILMHTVSPDESSLALSKRSSTCSDMVSVMTLEEYAWLDTSTVMSTGSYDNTLMSFNVTHPNLQKYLQKARLSSWLRRTQMLTDTLLDDDESSLSGSPPELGTLSSQQQFTVDSPILESRTDVGRSLSASTGSRTLQTYSVRSDASDTFKSLPESSNEIQRAISHHRQPDGIAPAAQSSVSEADDDDDDGTMSPASFVSAVASEANLKSVRRSSRITSKTPSMHEYVNLHTQLNQCITTSPILIASYVKHMTHYECSHWTALAPVPHLITRTMGYFDKDFLTGATLLSPTMTSYHNLGTSLPSSRHIPHFILSRPGFSPSMMVSKGSSKSRPKSPAQSLPQSPPNSPSQSSPPKSPPNSPPQSPPQSPTQSPTKSPPKSPPQSPTQSPPKSPPQSPPQSPTQSLPESHPQSPPQSPPQLPTTASTTDLEQKRKKPVTQRTKGIYIYNNYNKLGDNVIS